LAFSVEYTPVIIQVKVNQSKREWTHRFKKRAGNQGFRVLSRGRKERGRPGFEGIADLHANRLK
jgi:hypothetical protein